MKNAITTYETWEHAAFFLSERSGWEDCAIPPRYFGNRRDVVCFQKTGQGDAARINTDYFIGVDWLVPGKYALVVSPKLNTRPTNLKEEITRHEVELDAGKEEAEIPEEVITVNYFALLQQCLDNDYLYREIDKLVQIDWKAPEIPIPQSQDWLSPLLIVKFLNVLKSIVRKGLRKCYYPVVEDLNGKVKGKILVGQNIRQNVVKNRFTHTTCRFEEYGLNTAENRLLHKAFRFATAYLDNYSRLYPAGTKHFDALANYCRPAFEGISREITVADVKQFKPNQFFKEYSEGLHLAKLILKRYAYTISNTTSETVSTPPYWIDMPKLFELYVYQLLKSKFQKPESVSYQFSTYANALDFLVNEEQLQMVVDAKYKPVYAHGINHDDIRQVSGYARLEKVLQTLKVDSSKNVLVDCLIIYPDVANGISKQDFGQVDLRGNAIKQYRNIYKIGVKLPVEQVALSTANRIA